MAPIIKERSRIISDTQLEFLNWVYAHHSDDLKGGVLYGTLKTAVMDSEQTRNMGYDIGSPFGTTLNKIRDMFLAEYLKNRK